MKYYTKTIPLPLAVKLKEKGMPIRYEQTDEGVRPSTMFCEVFDWLMDKGLLISIGREYDFASERIAERFEWVIEKVGCFSSQPDNAGGYCDTWQEAANMAIEMALTLI